LDNETGEVGERRLVHREEAEQFYSELQKQNLKVPPGYEHPGGALRAFSSGDRVRVSDDFFWAKGAKGTISAPLDAVVNLSGPWDGGLTRQEKSALGVHTVYWVWFDEPQFDAEGDGPYRGGQIWESALRLLVDRPN
jgi:hypothetical protein